MSTQNLQSRPISRWMALRESTPTVIFLILAILAECFVVLYAKSLNPNDASVLQHNLQFPGSDWNISLAISLLFNVVPVVVVVTLLFSWLYLKRHIIIRPQETWKTKAKKAVPGGKKSESTIIRALKRFSARARSELLKTKGFAYLDRKTHSAKAATRGTVIMIFAFVFFVFVVSLLTYPQLIYRTVTNAFQNNPSLLGFVKGTGDTLAPIGNAFSILNGALVSVAPSFRDFALSLGNVIKPLASLDGAGKYLVFQNAAAWISALVAMLYVEFAQKGNRYKRR